jgi:molybdate transport system substrate-binding protein
VPLGNPAGISSIEDLGRPGVKLVLAAAHVPVGAYARDALEAAGLLPAAEANVVSNEEDVKGVVQKVILGEADAGIAYVTDTTPEVSGRLETVEIRSEANPPVTYPIAAIRGSPNPGLALRFVGFVLSGGQAALRRHGFLPAH